jgi:hypothetical protein
VTKDFVRMELQGATLIEPRPEGGILYTLIQHVRVHTPPPRTRMPDKRLTD